MFRRSGHRFADKYMRHSRIYSISDPLFARSSGFNSIGNGCSAEIPSAGAFMALLHRNGATSIELLSGRSRDCRLLHLHGAARLSVLDGQHGEIPAIVAAFISRIDDLANGTDSVDDLCAGWVGHEP